MRAARTLLLTATLLLLPLAAHAGLTGGVGVGVGAPFGDLAEGVGAGLALDAALGYELPIPLLRVCPELAASWLTFGADASGEADHEIRIVGGGLRVGTPGPISGVGFAHLGYGWLEGEGSDYVLQRSGLSWELGLGAELTMSPLFDVGVFAAYQRLRFDANANDHDFDTEHWVKFGVSLRY